MCQIERIRFSNQTNSRSTYIYVYYFFILSYRLYIFLSLNSLGYERQTSWLEGKRATCYATAALLFSSVKFVLV